MAAAAADSASFVSASWLRQWLQRDLEGSEEGARWDSISASGGVAGEAEAPAISLPEGSGEILCGSLSHKTPPSVSARYRGSLKPSFC